MKKNKLRCGGQILYVPAKLLRSDPLRPRIYFNNEELAGLTASIKESGIIKPLTVRPSKNGGYTIISGERRLRAAINAGLESLPCILIRMSDEEAAFAAITDNLRQSSLNYFEIPTAAKKIHEMFFYGYDQIADRFGISMQELTEKMRLLSIPENLRIIMLESGITERHARELVRLNDEDKRKIVDEIIEKRLNVTKTRQRCSEILRKEPEKTGQRTVTYFKDATIFINTLDHTIDTMLKSGIRAQSVKSETDDHYEYRVLIPK